MFFKYILYLLFSVQCVELTQLGGPHDGLSGRPQYTSNQEVHRMVFLGLLMTTLIWTVCFAVSMPYKVNKTVIEGEFFEEHQYDLFPTTWEGQWKKSGVFIENNPSVENLTCQFCKNDWAARMKNKPISSKLRSYRVLGVTKPDDFWEWEHGRCGNIETCWGPRDRIWDVRKSNVKSKWSFAHHKVSKSSFETVDRMYVTLERGAGPSHLHYAGIAWKGSQSFDFWPYCLPIVPAPSRFVHIEIASKTLVPHELMSQPVNEWPTYYMKPEFLNPNRITFRYFDDKPIELTKRNPTTLNDLKNYFPEIARTYVEMYPGGSGLKVSQYNKVSQFKVEEKRVMVDWLPSWWDESAYSGFVPGKQAGWRGPVVSYWSRLDANRRYFS